MTKISDMMKMLVVTHHISRVIKKINFIFKRNSGIVWRVIRTFLTARQSITICLVNYCWHILADGSMVRSVGFDGDNDATECQSRRKMIIPPESLSAYDLFNEIINLHDFFDSLPLSILVQAGEREWMINLFYWDHFMKFLFPLSDIMTRSFRSELFVSPEVILIKYFYISTEIFSCHYVMMNYTVHEFVIVTDGDSISFLSGERTKSEAGREKESENEKFNMNHCCLLFNIYFKTSLCNSKIVTNRSSTTS